MFAQRQAGTIVVPSGDSIVPGTSTLYLQGELGAISVSVPAMTGTGTTTVLGTDAIGGTIYTSTAIDESAKATVPPFGTPGFFHGTLTLTATPNGTQASALNIPYILYYGAKQG